MTDTILPLPLPRLDGPFQPGVTDPVWPLHASASGVDAGIYSQHYAGQIERQRHLHLVSADTTVKTRDALRDVLVQMTKYSRHEMHRKPPAGRPYDAPAGNRRVTITLGVGATLFTTVQGDDRFGLAALRPRSLKVIPAIDGDDGFVPREHATDLVVLVQSDDVYVNEYLVSLLLYNKVHPGIVVRSIECGYARPDSREPSGFEDGVSNPTLSSPDDALRRLVYVARQDSEPEWCESGTYLAYRKVRRRMEDFFDLRTGDREAVFGVDTKSGLRLRSSRPDSHAQKMNPRRASKDLFGILDEERRFLRRPYFFNDGLDSTGMEQRGVHHLSFARDLAMQYEWPVLMWQTNPDFPTKGAGQDALYGARGGAANIGGGYFFVPPAPGGEDDFLASALVG